MIQLRVKLRCEANLVRIYEAFDLLSNSFNGRKLNSAVTTQNYFFVELNTQVANFSNETEFFRVESLTLEWKNSIWIKKRY